MSKENIALIDVGNTRSTLGCFTDDGDPKITPLDAFDRQAVFSGKLPGLVSTLMSDQDLSGAVLASVVPEVTEQWVSAFSAAALPFLEVTHRTPLGIGVEYPAPETLGPDRLANAAGAFHRYGAPVAVADFGTALTFDLVLPDRGYAGGIICPGLPLMFQYLAEKTALLPELSPGEVPDSIGRSTAEGMQLGGWLGYRGMVREVFTHLKKEFGEDLMLVGTGGYHQWVLNGFDPPVKSDVDLTLYGLAIIYQLNRNTL